MAKPARTFPARPRPIEPATDLGAVRTLKHRNAYLLTDDGGDVAPGGRGLGLYDGDTRVLSHWSWRVDGARPTVLRPDEGGSWQGVVEAVAGELAITRRQSVGAGLRERVTIENRGRTARRARIELAIGVDGADIFEVRGYPRPRRGTSRPIEADADGRLTFAYDGLDGRTLRSLVSFDQPPTLHVPPAESAASVLARWALELAPGASRTIEARVRARHDPTTDPRPSWPTDPVDEPEDAEPERAMAAWRAAWTTIETGDPATSEIIDRSIGDLGLLTSVTADGEPYLAAGVPWFTALFGRDALIAAYQVVAFQPRIAVETLEVLARRQATRVDDWRDAEPGKILHELRTGELARTGELPFSPYYGTVDATPLWLILLGEVHDWTGDDGLVERLWPNVLAALGWLQDWADRTGRGFVEYARRATSGHPNQGWKDSADAIRHADGSLAEPPIALAEAQGYAYDARRRIARLAVRRGEPVLAARLEREAADLRARFATSFWRPELGVPAMAIDGEGRPTETVASNVGHALWSGIVDRARAASIGAVLRSPAMSSGWGLRTYAAGQAGFDPVGYHTGSVWPHDTAVAAAGLRRYGRLADAVALADAVLDAASRFPGSRLPELYGGQPRVPGADPVPYPVACSPQAWAAGAPLQLLRTLLGLEASAADRRLVLDRPGLPAKVRELALRGLRIGEATVDLRLTRRGTGGAAIAVEVLAVSGDLDVEVRP